MTSYLKCMAP